MTYKKTLDYLYSRLPIYQRKGAAAYKKDIGNIIKAVKLLDNPHLKFKSVHIAGTNGKGSTAHFIASVMQEAGYKVGLYTSPHLKDFRERIKINGEMIKKKQVVKFVKENKGIFEKINLSFFEFTVAMSFEFFAKNKVDLAIIETGLGGRLDSTNIINPELSIITNISLDHTNLLGNSIKEIAIEKAGIIKDNSCVIIGRNQESIMPIFNKVAKEKNTEIIYSKEYSDEYDSDLKGDYQIENIATCVGAIRELQKKGWRILEKNIKNGIKNCAANTKILGRWHILNRKPLTICDTAHNEDGVNKIVKQIYQTKYNNLHFILGLVDEKKRKKIFLHLPKKATYYFCKANNERGLDEKLLKKEAKTFQLYGDSYKSVMRAFESAKKNAKDDDLIFVGGSTFIVSEII